MRSPFPRYCARVLRTRPRSVLPFLPGSPLPAPGFIPMLTRLRIENFALSTRSSSISRRASACLRERPAPGSPSSWRPSGSSWASAPSGAGPHGSAGSRGRCHISTSRPDGAPRGCAPRCLAALLRRRGCDPAPHGSEPGRSAATVNGAAVEHLPAPRAGLLLVNIHGQHQSQSLLDEEAHRDLLDAQPEVAPLAASDTAAAHRNPFAHPCRAFAPSSAREPNSINDSTPFAPARRNRPPWSQGG